MAGLVRKINDRCLSVYAGESFVVKQKAKVLLWMHLLMIPIVPAYIAINIYLNDSSEMPGIIAVDTLFLMTLAGGLLLIAKGGFKLTANLDIAIITGLTVAGCVIKLNSQIETGFNHFFMLIFGVTAFNAMFGTRKVLAGVFILFLGLIAGLHIVAGLSISPENEYYLLSGTLNTVIALIILLGLSYMNGMITDKALATTQEELKKNIKLNEMLEKKVEERTSELKILRGYLPICSECKKIRDDKGSWSQIESYIRKHSEAEFSHGICPDCAKKLYPEFYGNQDR